MRGTVKWFAPDKGYGFIAPDGGDVDLFVHHRDLVAPYRVPIAGDAVRFDTEPDRKHPGRHRAVDVERDRP